MSKILAPILAALLLAMSVGLFVQVGLKNVARHDLKTTQADLTTANKSLATCQANTSQLRSDLTLQSVQVDALKAEADRRTLDSQKALKAVQRDSRASDLRVTALLNRAPKSSDKCDQADELEAILRGSVR